MHNETDIANLALTTLGKPPIVSMQENSPGAEYARQNFSIARRAYLARSDWVFARGILPLTEVLETSPFPGLKVYTLPADFLKVRTVDEEGNRFRASRWVGPVFRISDARLYTAAHLPHLYYTRDVTDPAQWPPLFGEAVAYKLASLIAVRVTGRPDDAQNVMSLAEAMLLRAIEVDAAQERTVYSADAEDGLGGPLAPHDWPDFPYDTSTFWGNS